jgi:hypothetical protein
MPEAELRPYFLERMVNPTPDPPKKLLNTPMDDSEMAQAGVSQGVPNVEYRQSLCHTETVAE